MRPVQTANLLYLGGFGIGLAGLADAQPSLEPKGDGSRTVCWKGDYGMFGDDRPNQDDATRLTWRERPDHGVLPIQDVLAELLDQYRISFPEINVMVVEEPSVAG